MTDDTEKPAATSPAAPATKPTAAVRAKPTPQPRTATAATPAAKKPVIKKAPVMTKAAPPSAKKPAARPAVGKSAPAKKVVQEPAPFVARTGKTAKAKKAKLIRDSFTMPEPEYALIAALKKRCLDAGVSAKKSEILRAAVASLAKSSDTSLFAAVRRLEVIKTGRPAKGSK